MKSINDSAGKSRQTVQSYQPVWMAHWMRPSSNATAERQDDSARGNKELDCESRDDDLTNGQEPSRSVKQSGVIQIKTESPRMSSRSLGNEGMSSSLVKHGLHTDEMQTIRPIVERGKAIGSKGWIQSSSGVPAANKTSLKEYHIAGEGTSKNPIEWVRTPVSAKDTSSATSTPFLERLVGSSTHIVPYHDLEKYEFDKGKAVVCPPITRPSIVSNNEFPNTKLRIIEEEHCQKHSQSADLICERKLSGRSESDTSMNACNMSPSMNGRHLPTFGQDWFHKMQNYSGVSLLPNHCIASEKKDSKVAHYDHYSLHKSPNVHDMETMRICTTVDSVEATPGGCPRFSQTTHSLFITKKTDVDISNENDIFRRFIAKMNGNSSSDLHSVTPYLGQANRGVKLQPLSSSSNSEGPGNSRDIGIGTSKVAIQNESSAETDTMDMDFLKEERPNSGANSSRSTKGFNFGTNLSHQVDVSSSREVGRPWISTGLPDINLELPALPAAASSSDHACRSSSRTQSLEMDMLLAHAEQPNPKSKLCLEDSSKADPTIRWVKRLKPSSLDSSARGTKSLNLPENSSHDKKSLSFRSILKKSVTSTGPTPRKDHGKKAMSSDRSQESSKEDTHFTLDPAKKGKELLLSHTWIKRWLRNGSQISQKKPETVVVCEPQSSKLLLDDLQKKQFPSIAAMALMGKAMTGFQSCELQKRGTFTVWNTKAF